MRLSDKQKLLTFFTLCVALNTKFCVTTTTTDIGDGLYTVEEHQKKLTQHNGGDESVKPVKARSPTECILKCRIRFSEGFFIEEQQNCYCFSQFDVSKDLSTSTSLETGQVKGKFYKKHQPSLLKSCKEVKKACPKCHSGIYTLEFEEPTNVYCDLVTDGGGWLLIGNMSLSDPLQASEMFNTVVKGNGQIASLSEASEGRFLISEDVSVLETLMKFTGFTELRVRCFKPSHGRTFHGILKGVSLMKRIFDLKGTYGLCGSHGNKEVRMLADDTSLIGEATCEEKRIGVAGANLPFYTGIIWVSGVAVVDLSDETRFECDDYYAHDGFKKPGDWQFYVR